MPVTYIQLAGCLKSIELQDTNWLSLYLSWVVTFALIILLTYLFICLDINHNSNNNNTTLFS